MAKINAEISKLDRLSIYTKTAWKIMRGLSKVNLRYKFPIFIGKSVEITHRKHIKCGKNVKFESYSEIHGLARDGLQFGDNVTIGRYTEIRPSSYYGVGNLGSGLKMGNNSSIGPYGFIGCSGKIVIGDNVMIGPRVSLFAENHNFASEDTTIKSQGVSNKGIVIEDDCWIGSGSVIGAGTLVNKDIPKNSVVYDKRNRTIKDR